MIVTIESEARDLTHPSSFVEMQPLSLDFRIGPMTIYLCVRMPPDLCQEHYLEQSVEVVKQLTDQVREAMAAIFDDPELADNIRSSIIAKGAN